MALSLIETGKRDPRLKTLKRISDALRVPLTAFLSDETNQAQRSSTSAIESDE